MHTHLERDNFESVVFMNTPTRSFKSTFDEQKSGTQVKHSDWHWWWTWRGREHRDARMSDTFAHQHSSARCTGCSAPRIGSSLGCSHNGSGSSTQQKMVHDLACGLTHGIVRAKNCLCEVRKDTFFSRTLHRRPRQRSTASGALTVSNDTEIGPIDEFANTDRGLQRHNAREIIKKNHRKDLSRTLQQVTIRCRKVLSARCQDHSNI